MALRTLAHHRQSSKYLGFYRPLSALSGLSLLFACSHTAEVNVSQSARPVASQTRAEGGREVAETLAQAPAAGPSQPSAAASDDGSAASAPTASPELAPEEHAYVVKPAAPAKMALAPGASLGAGRAQVGRNIVGESKAGAVADRARKASGGALAPTPAPLSIRTPPPVRERAFDGEGYAPIVENPFLAVSSQPLSTFSIDVDTASYSNARRFLRDGSLPPKDAIRVEEWLNYFSYGYAPPTDDEPFAISTEVTSCPWNASHRLLRVGIKGREVAKERVPPRNLVFLLDVSGSMMSNDKLPLVKKGLRLLTDTLRAEDSIAIAVYAGSSGLVLPPTSGAERSKIVAALDALEAGGSTNGGEGIELAYRVAQSKFDRAGINRVILATDGDFNVGTQSQGELTRLIEEKRASGVFLTVLGFGTGNVKDSTMELLADKGNGNYAYIDDLAEARKVLVREAGSTLVTIAKDVKLQVEFNPARVASYKLIGYENRVLAKEDFNDDRKDAGEIGAGHTVTALYEIVAKGSPSPTLPPVSPLKYQEPAALAPAASTNELVTVNVRYKAPQSDVSRKLSVTVADVVTPLERASDDYRFGVAVANVALLLRGSADVKQSSLESARSLAASGVGADSHGDRREFLSMVDTALRLRRSN